MTEPLAIDFAEPISLFPLPNCVLLPHATVPLHIFEPRYRAMTADAISGRRLIAMASFEGEQWKTDYQGKPPLRPHVCVGYILRHQELPDGRYNLLLQGLCRARIVEEMLHDPYRVAQLEPTETQPILEIDLGDTRELLEKLFADPSLKSLATISAIRNWLSREIPTHALIDLAIMTVTQDHEQRYRMLAENDVTVRARWLEKWLRDTRQLLRTAEQFKPEELPDHIHLN